MSIPEIVIYTTETCPYCVRAKRLLSSKGATFREVDLTHDAKTRTELTEKTGWRTVPMIFIGGKFVGGSDDLHRLDAEGALDKMLRGDGA